MLRIETNVPVPRRGGGQRMRTPELRMLKPGGSVFVPAPDDMAGDQHARLIAARLRHIKMRYGGQFTTRQHAEDGIYGVRVWRDA